MKFIHKLSNRGTTYWVVYYESGICYELHCDFNKNEFIVLVFPALPIGKYVFKFGDYNQIEQWFDIKTISQLKEIEKENDGNSPRI